MEPIQAALLGTGALASCLFGWGWVHGAPGAIRSGLKVGSVLALALASVGLGAPAAVTAGLALGALGDFFLSRAGQSAFMAGMAAFAAGHIAYASAFWQPGASVLMAVPVLMLAVSTEFWLAPHTGGLRWPVRAYVLVIAAMIFSVLSLGLAAPLITVGCMLFLTSDILLAIDMFVLKADPRPRLGLQRLVWVSYWGGQLLLMLGSLQLAQI